MSLIDNILAVLYDGNHSDNRIVRGFLGLKGKELVPFRDEDGLAAQVERMKAKGYRSKEVVILKKFHGRLFQKCPGSKNVICCNYYVLNSCFNCVFDCAYCFLNTYLNSYGIIQFINLEESMGDMTEHIAAHPDTIFRVGTGEFTDSLMFDEITGLAAGLLSVAARHDNLVLEFKTKSDNAGHLAALPDRRRAVIAWSLNTEKIISQYEKGAASLDERLSAAARAQEAGFLVAFHFDPVVVYDGFLPEYENVVARLFAAVDPERIAWISLGCFRYSRGFSEIIPGLFPAERLTLGEMFPGPDGKFRYLKGRRTAVYAALNAAIMDRSRKPFVYVCMETADVWKTVFGREYSSSDELEADFSAHLKKNFLFYGASAYGKYLSFS